MQSILNVLKAVSFVLGVNDTALKLSNPGLGS